MDQVHSGDGRLKVMIIGDRFAVGRPGAAAIFSVRQAFHVAAVGIHGEQTGTIHIAGSEDDPLTVGRPAGACIGVSAVGELFYFGAVGPDEHELGIAVTGQCAKDELRRRAGDAGRQPGDNFRCILFECDRDEFAIHFADFATRECYSLLNSLSSEVDFHRIADVGDGIGLGANFCIRVGGFDNLGLDFNAKGASGGCQDEEEDEVAAGQKVHVRYCYTNCAICAGASIGGIGPYLPQLLYFLGCP